MNKAAKHLHDGLQAGVSTYAGCALSDVVAVFGSKPGDTAIYTALITIALRVTANKRTESWA